MHIKALIAYLGGLEENNNRAWFVMNKPSYDILREEFVALVAASVAQVARFDAPIAAVNPKKALFRIHRDVRFSKDKRPYKTTFSAALAPSGGKVGAPMYYFQIDAQGELLVAAGCWHPQPDALKRIRASLAEDDRDLRRILRASALRSTYGGLDTDEALKRPPRGYPADHPAIELIKHRNIIVARREKLTNRVSADLAGEIGRHCKAAYPLVRWLRTVMGA